MDAIEVTARFDLDGKILPLRFTWQGEVVPIISTGRRWEDESGQLHILVMVPGEQVRELIFLPAESRWFLGPFGRNRLAA